MPANQQGYIVLKGWSICSGGHRLFAPAEGGQYTPAETGFSIRLFHYVKRALRRLKANTVVSDLITFVDGLNRDTIFDETVNESWEGSPNILIINVDEKASH